MPVSHFLESTYKESVFVVVFLVFLQLRRTHRFNRVLSDEYTELICSL
jgi:hypothetical protein